MTTPAEEYEALVAECATIKTRIDAVRQNTGNSIQYAGVVCAMKNELIAVLEKRIVALEDTIVIRSSLPIFLADEAVKTDICTGDEPWLEKMVYKPKRTGFPMVAVSAVVVSKLISSLKHWKKNHDYQVEIARLLKERTDVPLERVAAYNTTIKVVEKLEAIKAILEK